jgi:hypothetical protein
MEKEDLEEKIRNLVIRRNFLLEEIKDLEEKSYLIKKEYYDTMTFNRDLEDANYRLITRTKHSFLEVQLWVEGYCDLINRYSIDSERAQRRFWENFPRTKDEKWLNKYHELIKKHSLLGVSVRNPKRIKQLILEKWSKK